MLWVSGNNRFELNVSQGSVGLWTYFVNSSIETNYGIAVLDTPSPAVDVIWDRVQVQSYSVSDGRTSLNENVDINVTLIYAYDSASVTTGTVTINGLSTTHQGSGVWKATDFESAVIANIYNTVVCSGNTYGITNVDPNGQSASIIWDQLVITIGVDDSTPLNGVQANFSLSVIYDYDDTSCTTYQIAIQRNGTWWHSFTDTNKSSFVDSNFDNSYTYTVFVVTSEFSYGVLSFSTNSQQVVWSAAPNSAPVNDAAPNLANPDDTDNLYARYNFYIITSSVSDADGYNDIEYVELTLYDDSRTTPVWTVRYMVSGGIFSVESGDAYINMSASSFAVGAGNNLDVTWYIKIDWDHSDLIDVDMRQYVYDGIIGAEDFYESNWDVETRLEITGLTIDDGSGTTNRGPLDGAFSVSGTLIYLNSVDNYPLTNETDVWVSSSEYGTSTGPWSDFTLTAGQFGLTVYADDEVGQDTLTVKAVDEAGGSGGTDLLNSITQSTYIADQIAVQSYSALDPRINIDDTATIDVDLLYEYDLSPVINGSVTINGISATHLGSGTWRFTDTKSSVQLFTYNAVTYSGGIHGLTQVNQNAMTQDVIWDQIIVQTTFANDTRVDVGAYAEIRVTLWLAYDSLFLGSGDNVTLAGSAMTWDGSDGRFELAVNQSSVGAWIYFVNSSSESTYGITSLNLSGNNVSIIWDRIQVQSYSVSDDHVNIGDSVNIDVVLYYDYDDSPVTDGTITVNGISATHQGAGLWRFSDSEAAVVMNTYNLVAGSGNIHGLTVVDQNTQTQNVIWDQLVIVIGVDDASLVNGHQANFTLTVTFDYSDAVCTTYQIVIDRNETWWSLFVVANLSQFVDTNTDSTYFYNASSVSSESTYGITAFTTTTQKVTWSLAPNNIPVNDSSPVLTNGDDTDFLYARYRYYIITTSVSDLDGYVDISYVELTLYSDDQTTEYWTIRYTNGTDTFSLESGSSIVIADGMSYANGIGDTLTITWYIKIGWDHAVLVDTDILQFVSDGTDSASNFYETNWNFESRLDYSVAPSLSDDRGDINTADLEGTGSVTYYGSIHSPLANETDVWIVRDGVETWSGDLSAGSFNITSIGSPATVGLNNYTFKVVPEGIGSGGPDLYYTTSLTDTFITDRIEIYEAGVVNGRIDIDTDCEVWWRARYDYDNSTIQSGLILELTGSKVLTWDPTNLYWSWQEASAIPGLAGFDVASASESVYGLTVWFATTSVQQVIWDSLVITFTDPTDSRIDVGANATGITVSVVHAYDSTAFDGSLILNNSVFQYATPQKQGYTVNSASGGTYGITAIGINDETYCIWDRVLVVSVVADEAYHDPNDNVMLSVELQYEYDHSPVLAGSFALAGYSLTHSGAGVWEVPVTVGSYQSIDFDDLTSCNATLHVITEYNMNSNSVTVYWDRIEFHSVTVDDDRVNIGDSVQIRWSARLENAGIDIPSGIVAMMTGDVTCMPSGGFYAASVSQSTIGSSSFSIISASLGEISQFIQSSAEATVIWDRVKVASITATTPSVDAGTNAEIRVTLVYEFDNTAVTDGSVYLDNGGVATPMTYNSAGYWTALVSRTTAGNYTFTVDSVSGNAFGVSSLNTDGLSVQVEWVLVPGFVPDPMTLMIVGGGVGIALVGAAIVVSRRRRGAVSAEVGDLEASDFGVPEVVEEEQVSVEIEEDPVTEPEVEPEMEPGESEVSESEVAVSEAEVESISEPEGETEVSDVEEIEVTESAIEAETLDQMEEIEPEEVELPPVEEDFSDLETGEMELEPELEEIKETPPAEEEIPVLEAEDVEVEPEPEVPVADEVELPEEELEVEHKEPIVEPEQEPEVEVEEPIEPLEEPEAAESEEQVPEEFVEPIPKVDLSTLTKGELLDMIPDDIKATTPTSELKRLTKIELISLIESLLDAEE
ncbi:MAG: hypothetical protein ACFFCP_06675 [Promethearchaeota archaeon]